MSTLDLLGMFGADWGAHVPGREFRTLRASRLTATATTGERTSVQLEDGPGPYVLLAATARLITTAGVANRRPSCIAAIPDGVAFDAPIGGVQTASDTETLNWFAAGQATAFYGALPPFLPLPIGTVLSIGASPSGFQNGDIVDNVLFSLLDLGVLQASKLRTLADMFERLAARFPDPRPANMSEVANELAVGGPQFP